MKTNHIKAIIVSAVFLYSSAVLCLMGAEDDNLRDSAEKFVCQISEKDYRSHLQFYPMTEGFWKIISDDSVDWAERIERRFGRLAMSFYRRS